MEQVLRLQQCSTADTRTKSEQERMEVSHFKLPVPTQKEVSGSETKRSAMESCSSHSQEPQSQDDISLLKKEMEREKELHALIRREAKKHDAQDIFAALDSFLKQFQLVQEGCSLLTDRASPEMLFQKLKGQLRAALYEEWINQAHKEDSSSSSFLGGSQHDMIVQLRTIQQLREKIYQLQDLLAEQPNLEPRDSFPREFPLTKYHSVKQSVLVDTIRSPCYGTFDRDNCQSFGQYDGSAYEQHEQHEQHYEAQTVNMWNDSTTKFFRQFEIKLFPHLPSQSPTFLVAESTKRSFRSIAASCKRLFRKYVQSSTTSWMLLHKLASFTRKPRYEKFALKRKKLQHDIKEQLNVAALWYSNLKLPVISYSYQQLEGLMGSCQTSMTELCRLQEQIGCLLMELDNQ